MKMGGRETGIKAKVCLRYTIRLLAHIVLINMYDSLAGNTLKAELEITAGLNNYYVGHFPTKTNDQVPICLDMNPNAKTECPTKTQSIFLALIGHFTGVPIPLSLGGHMHTDC